MFNYGVYYLATCEPIICLVKDINYIYIYIKNVFLVSIIGLLLLLLYIFDIFLRQLVLLSKTEQNKPLIRSGNYLNQSEVSFKTDC